MDVNASPVLLWCANLREKCYERGRVKRKAKLRVKHDADTRRRLIQDEDIETSVGYFLSSANTNQITCYIKLIL